jgi:beta-lactamase regulating signal transducer with metallopeptidase domain
MILERWLNLLGAALAVTLVRGLVVFLVAFAVMGWCRKLSAEVRHLVWLGVIASFVLIPLAWLALPAIQIGARIPLMPMAPYRLAAAPVLSAGEYVQLVDRAVMQASAAGQAPPAFLRVFFLTLPFIWLAGVLILAIRLAVGRVRLLWIAATAEGDNRLRSLARKLAGQFCIRRRISVLLSSRCSIPFTFGVRRPVILLPVGAGRWSASRLHSALSHELAHIQRRDVLTQSIAYAVCLLFWFLPPLWLAFAALLREAETCCDQQVINRGYWGPEYAQDIVDLARSCEGHILLPCISSAIGRKSMLKERIRKILSLEPGRPPLGVRRALQVLAVCLACVLPILALTAQARPLLLHPTDPLFGTWTNSAYDNVAVEISAKVVLSADGSEVDYRKIVDPQPYATGNNTLEAAWVDADGNHWYKMVWVGDYHPLPVKEPRFKSYVLAKVSAAGDSFDTISGQYTYPKDFKDVTCCPSLQYRRQ